MNSSTAGRRVLFLLTAVAVFLISRHLTRPPNLLPPAAIIDPDAQLNWDQLMISSQKALKNNDVPRAELLCDRALKMAAGFGPHDTRYSKSQVQMAEIYCWEKSADLAEPMFKDAITNCQKAAGSASTEMVFPLSALANFYTFVSPHSQQVTPLLLQILKIVQNAPDSKAEDLIMWSRNVGQNYQMQAQYAQAESYFKQAVDLAQKADRADWFPHELLTAADFYRAWGKFDQAELLSKQALAIREEELKNSPSDVDKKLDVSVCLDNLGQTYLAAQKANDAEVVYRRSLTMVQTFMSPDQSDLTPRLSGLATAMRDQGKYTEAQPLYQQALNITEKNGTASGADTTDILDGYALLLKQMHKNDDAQGMSQRAAKIRKAGLTQ